MLFENIDNNILKKKKVMDLCYKKKIKNSLYYENYIYEPALKYTKMDGPI